MLQFVTRGRGVDDWHSPPCPQVGEQLPCRDSSVDIALVNGLFDLNPLREEIFRKLTRVTRPSGHVAGPELVLGSPLPEHLRSGAKSWFSRIAGAKDGGAFLYEFRTAGFTRAMILRTLRNAQAKHPAVVAVESRPRGRVGWWRRPLLRRHHRNPQSPKSLHCATSAIREGSPDKTQQMYDELLELIYKHLR